MPSKLIHVVTTCNTTFFIITIFHYTYTLFSSSIQGGFHFFANVNHTVLKMGCIYLLGFFVVVVVVFHFLGKYPKLKLLNCTMALVVKNLLVMQEI